VYSMGQYYYTRKKLITSGRCGRDTGESSVDYSGLAAEKLEERREETARI
jgi:hypothetical protein